MDFSGVVAAISSPYSGAILQMVWPILIAGAVALGLAFLIVWVKRLGRGLLPLPTSERVARMSGDEFERALRQIFERDGWRVELTPKSGDYGADLVMSKDGRKVVVQAKRWKRPAGIRAVQETLGARDRYHADEAWVVCTSGFTLAAVRQAKASQVRLKDGHWLSKRLGEVGRSG